MCFVEKQVVIILNGKEKAKWKQSCLISILLLVASLSLGYIILKPTHVNGSEPTIDSTLSSNFVLANANFSKVSEYDNNFDNFDTNDLFISNN